MRFLANTPLATAATRAQAALTGLPGAPRILRALVPEPTPTRSSALAKRLDRQLILPCADTPLQELTRSAIQDEGQFLARQDRWDDAAARIRLADDTRAATPCAMSHAELLAYGARADVVQAAEDAIRDGVNPSLSGIEALEELLIEYEGDYTIACIVALAHTDIGWAWRGDGWPHEIPERNLSLFHAHFGRAEQIVAALDTLGKAPDTSPLLASVRCALIAAHVEPGRKLAKSYEHLISLDPGNPRPMRAFGNHLLPRWFGSYDQLDLEARRTAARTIDTWGNGGYAWVYMDALVVDPGAARAVDIDFFTDGLRDILAHRPDQHIANGLAAYAAVLMDPKRTPQDAPDILRSTRQQIHGTLDWILGEYLYEVHPLLWAQAALGPNCSAPLPMRTALIRKGVDTARMAIARHFEAEINAGTTVAFSRHGLRLYPAL